MRSIAVLCILAGLAAIFGYPYYHAKYTNFEIGTYTVYDKSSGFTDQRIALAQIDAPMNIDFQAVADSVDVAGGSDTAFLFNINDAEGRRIRAETIRFSGPMGDTSATTTSAIEMNVAVINMPIEKNGDYAFEFTETHVQEIPLARITMKLTGNVAAMNEQASAFGYGLLALGAVFMFFGGRRGRKAVGNAPMGTASKASRIGRAADTSLPKAKQPEKAKHKWGRGE